MRRADAEAIQRQITAAAVGLIGAAPVDVLVAVGFDDDESGKYVVLAGHRTNEVTPAELAGFAFETVAAAEPEGSGT